MTVVPPADRGPGWEYVYFASELARGVEGQHDAYLEYQSGVVRPMGAPVPDPSAYIHTLTDEITGVIEKIDQLLKPAVLERAFGPPGKPGDDAFIRQVAAELCGAYAQMISWGMKVRGARVDERWRPVFVAVAKYVNSPLHQFQDFSATLSASVARMVGDIRAGRTPEPLQVALSISIDPNASAEFHSALEALRHGEAASPATPTPVPAARSRYRDPAPPPPTAPRPVTGTPLDRVKQLPQTAWFARFGDIPGVDYQTPPQIDPTKVPGYGMTPEFSEFDSGGKHYESLSWSYGETSSSASPLKELLTGLAPDDSLESLLAWCAQGLEMPAEPSDYHFHLSTATTALHRIRRTDPAAIPELERLCLLDLALIDAWPRAVYNDYGEDPVFYGCSSFGELIALYETEGALHEALEIAEHAAQFLQMPDRREDIAARIASVDAEIPSR